MTVGASPHIEIGDWRNKTGGVAVQSNAPCLYFSAVIFYLDKKQHHLFDRLHAGNFEGSPKRERGGENTPSLTLRVT
jgi:hypothetical protein